MEDTITKIRNLVDSNNGEVEVEGCLLFDYNTDSYIDILKVYNDEGIYQVEVDHINDCKLVTHSLNWFPESDLESILKYIIK